jgi:signal transduction histidine kinase
VIAWLPRLIARIPASVHTKLLVAFLSIVVMFVALGAVGLSVLRASNERAESLLNQQQKIAAFRQLQRNTTEQLYTVTSAMFATDERTLDAARRQLNHSAYDFEHARFVGSKDAPGLAAIQSSYEELIEAGIHVIDLIRQDKLQEARDYQKKHAIPLADRLERKSNALVNKAEADMVTIAEISSQGHVTSQVVVFGVALGGVLFALILGYSISSSLIGPVNQMNRRFQEIAHEDFSSRIEVPNRDELGSLANALNDMSIELGRLYREIHAASRHKSEFLANMSHELRTPLNAIIGFSQVLDERVFGELNEKQAEYINDIHESGAHLLSLINDILDLSKVEAGRMELDLKKFDVRVALDNALTLVKERSLRHGLSLEVDLDPDLGNMVADERKLKQILLNLLTNAIKFTPEGGTISISAGIDEKILKIAIRDTGIGISPEDQKLVFEEFRQASGKDGQVTEGTGLGLTLTKRFVEMHGGEISVESETGKGSIFRFSLPLTQVEERQVENETGGAAAMG